MASRPNPESRGGKNHRGRGQERSSRSFQTQKRVNRGRQPQHSDYSMPPPIAILDNEIPPGYLTWGEKGVWLEGEILEGSYLRCMAGEVYTPTLFYLNLHQNWHYLENFMANLQ